VLIAIFYLLGTVGILMAVPLENLNLVEGIIDTLRLLLGESGVGGAMVILLGIGALFTLLANMVTWTMGANRTAAEASAENELPSVFGKLHPVNKTPVNAFIITGIVSTAVIVLYGFMAGSAEDLFWTLFAFSSMVFLLPYLTMFPAFLKLRRSDPEIERPYKVPGGQTLATIIAVICELFIIQAIVFFIWVPGEPMDWGYALPILVGVVVTLIVGEILLVLAKKQAKTS